MGIVEQNNIRLFLSDVKATVYVHLTSILVNVELRGFEDERRKFLARVYCRLEEQIHILEKRPHFALAFTAYEALRTLVQWHAENHHRNYDRADWGRVVGIDIE